MKWLNHVNPFRSDKFLAEVGGRTMARLVWAAVVILGLGLTAVMLWLVDRMLLRAEERGWIYYRKKKPLGGTFSSGVASAMREMDRLAARPSVEYTIEAEKNVVEGEERNGE
jgi:hypothetical protein